MRVPAMLTALGLAWTGTPAAFGEYTPSDHPLFAGDAVHRIDLTFHQPDWWQQLQRNFEGQPEPSYLEAAFDWGDVHFDRIGVRFKGLSSYEAYPGSKKPFKLDLNEYVAGQHLSGLDKLTLNNGFMDPSFVREKVAYELCQAVGLPAGRSNFVALHINGAYWGLYTLVERPDKNFIQDRFGSSEDGNLWKGDPQGTLEYRGPDQAAYHDAYELKTNRTANDWSGLVELVDRLNNTDFADLPAAIDPLMDVESAMALLAVDNLIVNLDSYSGLGHNYYLYHRDLDGRFVFANWDLNLSWGIFDYGMTLSELKTLDPLWTAPAFDGDRPLASRLWQVPGYREVYLGHIRALMAGAAEPNRLLARMNALRDMIRPYVQADPNKMFSDAEFEAAMTTDISVGALLPGLIIPGLEAFIRDRDLWLRRGLGAATATAR